VAAVPPWFRQHVLSRLSNVRQDARDPCQFYARCPAHSDRHNSFAIRPGDRMAVVYSCKLGCDEQAIRQALADLGVDDEYLGIYGTPGYIASRHVRGTSTERRKLDRIAGLLHEQMTPAMLKVRVQAAIEGIGVPGERKPFLALADRAGVGQRQRYEAWALVFASQAQPECVPEDHVVLTASRESCQVSQVTADVRFAETANSVRKPQNGQNGTVQVNGDVQFAETAGQTREDEPDMEQAVKTLAEAGLTRNPAA
jgi:hypothetical protein